MRAWIARSGLLPWSRASRGTCTSLYVARLQTHAAGNIRLDRDQAFGFERMQVAVHHAARTDTKRLADLAQLGGVAVAREIGAHEIVDVTLPVGRHRCSPFVLTQNKRRGQPTQAPEQHPEPAGKFPPLLHFDFETRRDND
ncbi:MAG: hypothetical protein A2V91_04435 [Candidatus Muproteobacteria bacterium RBG_16_64_10]|uniref:Uncharacterized protein n=1 Tax=Candidatus Muproteobacteria bacterium RBG_16_64_10 TaxID=1817757 RepID=A0A1F6T7I1_9PROT|nr:MAG: hypothetical protein A2V91_04435 [Candidatus Muproteobacteria bacterium RBG_16_64_10]